MSRKRTPASSAPRTERSLIAWLRRRAATGGLLGDDAAIFPPRGDHVVTVDTQIAGVHFPDDLMPAIAARRLLAVNLSDLAAMGARPAHAFLVLAAPRDYEHEAYFEALLSQCAKHRLVLAGGDLARSERLFSSLALIGERWPGQTRWLRRDVAQPGHVLWIGGGTLGESSLGLEIAARGGRLRGRGVTLPGSLSLDRRLERAAGRALRRHFLPSPQLELGRWLARQRAGAAIDVSDGLARDLHNLCSASRVGAVIEEASLPLPTCFRDLAESLCLDPRTRALAGGEDYVLLFTLPRGLEPDASLQCRRIGQIVRDREILVQDENGDISPLPDLGWDHLRRESGR